MCVWASWFDYCFILYKVQVSHIAIVMFQNWHHISNVNEKNCYDKIFYKDTCSNIKWKALLHLYESQISTVLSCKQNYGNNVHKYICFYFVTHLLKFSNNNKNATSRTTQFTSTFGTCFQFHFNQYCMWHCGHQYLDHMKK